MIITILAAIFVIGTLVFVHELGHFVIAKMRDVKVLKFSLGFPPTMISKKIGETEYCISWIPLGGYVKMEGEDPQEADPDDPRNFANKKVWERSSIISAGPIMNFLLGILLLWGVYFLAGQVKPQMDSTQVGTILSDSPAKEVGLKSGDKIIQVKDKKVSTWEEMAKIVHKFPEEKIFLKWSRGDSLFSDTVTTMLEEVRDSNNKTKKVGVIGISPSTKRLEFGFTQAFKKSLATTYLVISEILKFIFRAVQGKITWQGVGGPVRIAQLAGKTARAGIVSLASFIALLSINLGLLNALPIPVLDGGHLVFLGIEKLRGGPLKAKTRMFINQISVALLLALMVLITIKDILRIF